MLIGDAAVTCHPLTATGMTMCITDALLLRDAIAGRPNDLRQALHCISTAAGGGKSRGSPSPKHCEMYFAATVRKCG